MCVELADNMVSNMALDRLGRGTLTQATCGDISLVRLQAFWQYKSGKRPCSLQENMVQYNKKICSALCPGAEHVRPPNCIASGTASQTQLSNVQSAICPPAN